jgi:hypothetical protein
VSNAFISLFNTQTLHTKSYTIALLFSLKKTYTLMGFEPGYSVLQAAVITTVPRRQGYVPTLFAALTDVLWINLK